MFNKKQKNISDKEAKRLLPHNRKELFFDLLRNRKMTLFAISCYVFMFFIPLAIDLIYFNFMEMAAIANGDNKYIFSLIFYSMIIMIPCMIVGFIGLGGAFSVIKKLVWQEGISIAVDFFHGIKENWLYSLLNGVIFAILTFGLVVGSSFLLIYSPTSPIWCGIGIGALGLFFILFGIVICFMFTQGVYYSNPYRVAIKNSFSFLALTNWKAIVLFICSTGLVVILGMLNAVTLYIGLFLFAILNSVVITLWTLISHSAFDKYINVTYYPDYVNKGLYKEVKEETSNENEK